MHAMTVSDVNIAPLRLVRNQAIPITHLQVPKLSYPFQNIMYMHYNCIRYIHLLHILSPKIFRISMKPKNKKPFYLLDPCIYIFPKNPSTLSRTRPIFLFIIMGSQ